MNRSLPASMLGFLLMLAGVFGSEIQAQQMNPDSLTSAGPDVGELSSYMDDVRALVSNMQLFMNFIGDAETSLRDKDVIINQSYSKLFQNEQVQIEDDLDSSRRVVTYKPVQAYLKDIDFFFETVRFEFRIEMIEQSYRENGKAFYLVSAIRQLQGTDLNEQAVSNQQQRFIEVNLTEGELKIASIYTTKLNQGEERRLWWSSLSHEWKSRLAGNARLTDEIALSDIKSYSEQLLATPSDTFLLKDWETASAGSSDKLSAFDQASQTGLETQGNQLASDQEAAQLNSATLLIRLEDIDTTRYRKLPLNFQVVDALIEGLVMQRSLKLEGPIADLEAVARFSQLRQLELSNCGVSDISPLRQLTKLKELVINNNPIADLGALQYLSALQVIKADSTSISSLEPLRGLVNLRQLSLVNASITDLEPISQLNKLEQLNLRGTGIDSLQALKTLTKLRELDIAGTPVRSLKGLQNMQELQLLDASRTSISSLATLSACKALERLLLNNSPIAQLGALNTLPKLKIVYCDGTKVGAAEANALMDVNKGVVVIYASDYLKKWWDGIPPIWQQVFQEINAFSGSPNDEQLQQMTAVRKLNLSIYPTIRTLDPIKQLDKLESLDISSTAITSLEPLAVMSSLQKFTAENCQLRSILPLSAHRSLRQLNLNHSPTTDMSPLFNLSDLELVQADSTGITDSMVVEFLSYRPQTLLIYRTSKLYTWWAGLDEKWQGIFSQHLSQSMSEAQGGQASVRRGELDRFDLERIASLKVINISPGSISSLENLRMLKKLVELRFAGNQVYSLSPLRELTTIEVLDCSMNPLAEIGPLSVLKNLKELDISESAVRSLDQLEDLQKLETLKCKGTPVKQLNALGEMTNLTMVDCSNTKVRSLKPLLSLPSLKQLIAFNTSLSKYKIEAFQASNPACEVVFY